MSTAVRREPVPRLRTWRGSPILAHGFRPFFLLAAIAAAATIAVWMTCLFTGMELPSRFDPLAWHVHESLFGFGGAAICGFLLTAVPNWTGRLPLNGYPLLILVLIWLAGRVAMFVSAHVGILPSLVIDCAFLSTLGMVIGREIVVGRNWRNLPIVGAVMLLACINGLTHLSAAGILFADGADQRAAIGVIIMLISLIGGRIVPSFTRNWLAKRQASPLPASFDGIDRAALAITALALSLWSFWPDGIGSAIAAGVAALLAGVRLVRWQGLHTRSEPLLLVLHGAYAWIPIGLALIALSAAWDAVPAIMAVHAFGVGAMGTMILAVMTRATLGHTGRSLQVGTATTLIYLLVSLAAVCRVAAAALPSAYGPLLGIAALGWVSAFLGYAVVYGPMLCRRRIDGRPG